MKLMPFTVIVLGISIAIIVLAAGFFQFYQPLTTEAGYWSANADRLEQIGAQLPASRKKLEDAIELRRTAAADWQEVVLAKTPPASPRDGGIDLNVDRYTLVNQLVAFRNKIQSDVNRQMKVGGIKVLSGPVVPMFPDNPANVVETGFNFPPLPFPVRVFDFGAVRVQGTMDQIKRHVESWSDMPNYLAVADGLVIEGTSPTMTATYNLSMVMYIRASEVFPPVPTGAAPANAGGVPGGAAGGGFQPDTVGSRGGAPIPGGPNR